MAILSKTHYKVYKNPLEPLAGAGKYVFPFMSQVEILEQNVKQLSPSELAASFSPLKRRNQ